jgi:hypothetical protein
MRNVSIISALLGVLALSISSALGQISPIESGREPTVREPFSSDNVSGYVEHLSAYNLQGAKDIVVFIRLRRPALLYCMGYADFRFILSNVDGQIIDPVNVSGLDQAKLGGPIPNVIVVPPKAEPGKTPSCPYLSRIDAVFRFDLSAPYPRLKPGVYHLAIEFAPRDGSAAPVRLTQVSFSAR